MRLDSLLLGVGLALVAACRASNPGDYVEVDDLPSEDSDDDDDDDVNDNDNDGDGFDETEDCDDADPSVHPDATEVCNGIDDDCDGDVDDADESWESSSGGKWFSDGDGDGFGDPSSSLAACIQPSGYIDDDTDCDDADEAVHPDATEICNGIDDDCDGLVDGDDASLDTTTMGEFYLDADGDGHGDDGAETVWGCEGDVGLSADATDCDDADAAVYPGAPELCDLLDQDCDGIADELTDAASFRDAEGRSTDYTSAFSSGSETAGHSVILSDDGTLTVCPGTYYVNLSIDAAAVDVAGLGDAVDVVLDGATTASVVWIEGGQVTLSDLTQTHGTAAEGGGLYALDAEVQLDEVVVTDNAASDYGGGVRVHSSDISISASEISHNTTDGSGGGFFVSDHSDATLDDVHIEGNVASSTGGGVRAEYLVGLRITDSTLTANEANRGGGFHHAYWVTSTIDGSVFSENQASEYGGAISYFEDKYSGSSMTLDITQSDFEDNGPEDLWNAAVDEAHDLGLDASMTCTYRGCE